MIYILTLSDETNVTYESTWNTEDGTIAEYERELRWDNDNDDRTVTDIRPATVRESLVFTFGEGWSRSIDHIVTTFDEPTVYPAKVPSIVFRYAQSNNIWGYDDNVSVANYRVLVDEWSEYDALDPYGPYSNVRAIALTLDEESPADLIDVINSLADYPVLNDDELCVVEHEMVTEHWDSYGRSDTVSAVETALGLDGYGGNLTDYALEVINTLTFSGLIHLTSSCGEYPEILDESMVDFGHENVAEWIKARLGRTVILPHYGREYRFDLRKSALVAR
jgi:hypothetical protein